MNTKRFANALLTLSLVMGVWNVNVHAQVATDETLQIKAGDVFELLAYSPDSNSTFTWVLMQDGNFLQAARSHFIQIRLTQPGTYQILGEQTAENSEPKRRIFELIVHPQDGIDDPADSEASDLGIRTSPPTDGEGRVFIAPTQQVVAFYPTRDDLEYLRIDLDAMNDRNGDGDPTNDDDTAGTAFSTGISPLHVWHTADNGSAQMILESRTVDGNTELKSIASLPVNSSETPELVDPSESSGDGDITAQSLQNGNVQFSVDLDFGETPVLYQWDFGDSQQSLLQSPIHTFGGEGPYTVRLIVRDLETGETLETLETEIVVDQSGASSENSASSEPEEVVEPVNPDDEGDSTFIGLALRMIGAFLGAGILGGIIAFLISKLRKGQTLEQRFATAEKNLVGKTPDAEVMDIAPMALSSSPEPEVEVVNEPAPTHTPLTPKIEDLQVQPEAAPSWLQQGMNKAVQSNQTVTSPPPAPIEEAPPPPPVVEPAPQPIPEPAPEPIVAPTPEPQPAPAPVQEEAPMPDWLKPPAPVAQPAPQPAPEPAPVVQPAPVPEPTPAPAPVVAPTPEPQVAPAPVVETPAPQPVAPAPVVQPEPTPAPVAPVPVAAATPESQQAPAQEAPKTAAQLEKEERLRQKRREKRKRYRENQKARAQAEKAATGSTPATEPQIEEDYDDIESDIPEADQKAPKTIQAGEITEDEPVAYIRAESIEEQNQKDEEAGKGDQTKAA